MTYLESVTRRISYTPRFIDQFPTKNDRVMSIFNSSNSIFPGQNSLRQIEKKQLIYLATRIGDCKHAAKTEMPGRQNKKQRIDI